MWSPAIGRTLLRQHLRAGARHRPLPTQERAGRRRSFDLEGEVELGRREERGGTLVAGARRRQSPGGPGGAVPARGQRRRAARQARRPWAARARRGTPMPARGGSRDLVELDERGPCARARPRSAVQFGARRLRQRVVGGVADQQVAETEPVLAGELRPIGPDQLLADERGEAWVTWASSGERAHAPRWKISPSTEPRSSTPRSAGSSWSRRAASSARTWAGRHVAVRVARHREHLADEQRVAACGASDPLAQLSADARRGSARRRLRRPSGSSRSVTGHVGRRSSELRSRHAEQEDRAPVERSATCSTRSRNVSSPHWMSSRTTTSGARRGPLERLAERPGDLLRRRWRVVSPSSERIAAAAASSEGRTSSCFRTSTTGQYVIPSP